MLVMILALSYGLQAQTTAGWTDDPATTVLEPFWTSAFSPGVLDYVNDRDSVWHERVPIKLGKTLEERGSIYLPVLNVEGSTLERGTVCVYDSTRILVADTTKELNASIQDDLSDYTGLYTASIVVIGDGTAADDSLWIYGLDADGASQSEVLVITDGANSYTKSANSWTQIDSVKDSQASGGWDSYDVIAYVFGAVRESDGNSYDFAGIVAGRDSSGTWVNHILDNNIGYAIISGVSLATCDGGSTTIYPGTLLAMAAGGDLTPFAHTDSSDVSRPVAMALDFLNADNREIPVRLIR